MMGALVFNALEAPNEEFHHDELQATRQEFLGNYTCVNPDNLSYLIDVSIGTNSMRSSKTNTDVMNACNVI